MTEWLLIGIYPWQRPLDDGPVPIKYRLDHETLAKLDYQIVLARADAHMLPTEWARVIMPENRVTSEQWRLLDWWLVHRVLKMPSGETSK